MKSLLAATTLGALLPASASAQLFEIGPVDVGAAVRLNVPVSYTHLTLPTILRV